MFQLDELFYQRPRHQSSEGKEALRAVKEMTRGIKAQVTIRSDGVEVKIVTGNAEAAQYLAQIGEHLATGIGQTLHYMFGITGEIVRCK